MGDLLMNVLSLFSGCGGMDIGFEGDFWCLGKSVNMELHRDWVAARNGDWVRLVSTGFKTVFANDIRPSAKTAWMRYFEKRNKAYGDIYHLDSIVDLVKRQKSGEDIFPRDIDVVTGGFPCQDFSVAGKRLGFNSKKSHTGKVINSGEPSVENRGQLYMWMREVISLVQPKLFVAENVKGLTNLEDVKSVIENDFSDAGGGYFVVPAKVINAKNYGVPQSRERVIFFGFRKSALKKEAKKALVRREIPRDYDPYPTETHGEGLLPMVTCRDAFNGLVEPDLAVDIAQKKYSGAKFMGAHCQGQKEIDLDDVSPTIRSEHHGNIEYRRLSKQHGGQHRDELEEGLIERRLTVRECARIQTFPDDYEFVIDKELGSEGVSASEAYKIIGNAVPCLLAFNIAKNIESKWEKYFEVEK